MLARGAEGRSGGDRQERSGAREERAGPGLGAALTGEAKLVRVTREAVARIGPELRRLEKLRAEVQAQLAEAASEAVLGRSGEESLLALLARILEHGILGIEEGGAELHECFSDQGLARLRRKLRAERTAQKQKRSRP